MRSCPRHGRSVPRLSGRYQTFNVNPNATAPDIQNAKQSTTVDSRTITRDGWQQQTLAQHFAYPLTIDFAFVQNADGSFSQTTTTDQRDEVSESLSTDGSVISRSRLHNEVHATDTLNYDSGLNFQGSTGSKTSQTYVLKGNRDECYSRTISAADHVLVSVDDDDECR